jgi:hypothetical protein
MTIAWVRGPRQGRRHQQRKRLCAGSWRTADLHERPLFAQSGMRIWKVLNGPQAEWQLLVSDLMKQMFKIPQWFDVI